MNSKWYIQIYLIRMFSNYWNNASETLYFYKNTYYVLSSSMTSEFVKEIITEEQYDLIISNIINQDMNCEFKYVFEIPEEKLFLMKLKYPEIIDYLINDKIFEGDDIQEGIIIW